MKDMRAFLGILVTLAALLLTACALQQENSAGEVNGVNIKRNEYINALRGHFQGFVMENDRTPDEGEKRELINQTWKDITTHVVLTQYFKKYQIQVSEQEVVDTLLNDIPLSMYKAPVFQRNGVFDKSIYSESLLQNKPVDLTYMKQYYFSYYVPLAKLKQELSHKSILTREELSRLGKVLNSSADISWIVFDPTTMQVNVSQEEIDNYYQAHISDYAIKPWASYVYTTIPVIPTEMDEMIAHTRIDSIATEIRNGATFRSMARNHSTAASAVDDGDIGFVKTEELPAAIRTAIANLNKDEVSPPIHMNGYWLLVQLVERTKTLVRLNEIRIAITPGEAAKTAAQDKAVNLRDLALQLGLPTAANELDFSTNLVNQAARDSLWKADTNLSAYISDRVFTQKAGAVLEPIYSDTGHYWIVMQVTAIQPYAHTPLPRVNDAILATLRSQKQLNYASEQAEVWINSNKATALETARREQREIITSPAVTVKDSLLGSPIRASYVNAVENHIQGKTPQPVTLGEKVYLPIVTRLTPLNPPLFKEYELRSYYFTYINPEWFNNWLATQVKKADVRIWMTSPQVAPLP